MFIIIIIIISNKMLVHLGNTALSKLLGTLNLSWSQEKVPQIWREERQ